MDIGKLVTVAIGVLYELLKLFRCVDKEVIKDRPDPIVDSKSEK